MISNSKRLFFLKAYIAWDDMGQDLPDDLEYEEQRERYYAMADQYYIAYWRICREVKSLGG